MIDIEKKTEWLREFDKARNNAGYALGSIAAQVETLREAGLDGVADKLTMPLKVAEESVAAMDAAISRMINEDVQDSFDNVRETFTAILKTVTIAK